MLAQICFIKHGTGVMQVTTIKALSPSKTSSGTSPSQPVS
jgi:hypothetical protein